ncbi:hypothetical protein G6F46_013426 [Rhizopus delemar]|nr:hypothetical protein G6F46_013426 [Rhizopus delemar]
MRPTAAPTGRPPARAVAGHRGKRAHHRHQGLLGAGSIAAGSRQAINGGQLFQSLSDAASFLGGGASVGMQGVFVAPNYVIQGATYSNVGDALGALDRKVSEIDRRTAGGTRAGTASRRAMSAPLEDGAQASVADARVMADAAPASTARVQGTPTAAAAGAGAAGFPGSLSGDPAGYRRQ